MPNDTNFNSPELYKDIQLNIVCKNAKFFQLYIYVIDIIYGFKIDPVKFFACNLLDI